MIDCNVTENFLKERVRMCDSISKCSNCTLERDNNGEDIDCNEFVLLYPTKAIEMMQKWSDENPKKTYLQDFKEKFPNALLRKDGLPKFCASLIYNNLGSCNCVKADLGCSNCWNKPIEE